MDIIPVKNREKRYEALKNAFEDHDFQKDIEEKCEEIRKRIDEYVKTMPKIDERMANVFSITSRPKGLDTFLEKIQRKDYVTQWDISNDLQENIKLIKNELTDLIGIRINCNFGEYTRSVLEHFRKLEQNPEFASDFKLNFEENNTMSNGYQISKFSGHYCNEYRFEIQIKHMLEGTWGEVEHKVVYKSPSYDAFYDKKKEIADSLHDIMESSDKQLYSLFKMEETETQLFRSFFFLRTKEKIQKKLNTKILANHYSNYFKIFDCDSLIKNYVITSLNENEYKTQKIGIKIDECDNELLEMVRRGFNLFYIDALYQIDCLFHSHETFDDFLKYFILTIQNRYFEIDDDDFEYPFADEDEDSEVNDENQTSNWKYDVIKKIESLLNLKIKENERK